MQPLDARLELSELKDKIEPVIQEKFELESKITLQETRLEIVQAIAYNNITEKLSEKNKTMKAMLDKVVFRGEITTVSDEMEKLSELESQFCISKAKLMTAEKNIDILRSILSYDRDSLKLSL